jgi:hypothetical protein
MPVNIDIDQQHKYHVTADGKEHILPSVTTILADMGLLDTRWFEPEDAERGTYVHKACEYLDQGDLDEDSVREDFKGYVDGWKAFKADYKFKPDLIERRLWFPQHPHFAGTLDRTGTLNLTVPQTCLIDIKSGSNYQKLYTSYQLVGYYTLLKANKLPLPEVVMSAHVHKDGKYKVYTVDNPERLIPGFMAFVGAYYAKRERV